MFFVLSSKKCFCFACLIAVFCLIKCYSLFIFSLNNCSRRCCRLLQLRSLLPDLLRCRRSPCFFHFQIRSLRHRSRKVAQSSGGRAATSLGPKEDVDDGTDGRPDEKGKETTRRGGGRPRCYWQSYRSLRKIKGVEGISERGEADVRTPGSREGGGKAGLFNRRLFIDVETVITRLQVKSRVLPE